MIDTKSQHHGQYSTPLFLHEIVYQMMVKGGGGEELGRWGTQEIEVNKGGCPLSSAFLAILTTTFKRPESAGSWSDAGGGGRTTLVRKKLSFFS